MSILASLVRAYDRLEARGELPPFGYASQGIHFCISLNLQGEIVDEPFAFESEKKGKPIPRMMDVPYFGGRSGSSAPPYFLWDNSAYVLGVTAKENFDAGRRFEAFQQLHLEALAGAVAPSLLALRKFLQDWAPEKFAERAYPQDILDRNVVFRLMGEHEFVHEHEEAKSIWNKIYIPDVIGEGVCLITGLRQPIARLHPPIKTFDNPARIVSFDKNNDAFSSYEHVQAENAPTGIRVAFAYTAVLNRFLEHDSNHRIQIGDASTVFWADAENIEAAEQAESLFSFYIDPKADDEEATKKIGIQLARIRKGEHLTEIEPKLEKGVKFYVLGLAPNAARLSIRFFYEGSFGELTRNYQRFIEDMHIEPPPRDAYPPLWRYLRETAVLGKSENVPPNLAGEWMRSILTGKLYPQTLLSAVITRIRADGDVNALRVSILKALLIRNFKTEAPVALDPDNKNKGYLLGRLFAAYEQAQTAALGTKVNATIKDKFYGSASAQPRKVFALLESGSANHLSKVGKQSVGRRINLEKLIGGIMDSMDPEADPFPASLNAEEQALFGLGYYHQRNEFFKKSTETAEATQ